MYLIDNNNKNSTNIKTTAIPNILVWFWCTNLW